MGICGGRPGMPGGAGTSRTGNTARMLMWPLASTLSRSLPPASATSRTPGRASSPLGSLSISRPGWAPAPLSGLLLASKVGKSATKRTVWPVTRSSRPKASAPAPNCWRVCGPPNGPLTSTYCLAPVSETSDGPSAKLPPAWATDGRPVRTRCWVPRQMRVTAPLGPKHTSAPSGPGAQGPAPPAPASATYKAPPWPKAIPRGLSSPLATTRRPPAAVAAVAVPAALAAADGDCGAADAWPPRAATAASTSRLPRMPARRNSLCMEISSSRGWVLCAPPGARSRRDLCGPFRVGPPSTPTVPGPSLVSDTIDEPYRFGWWWRQYSVVAIRNVGRERERVIRPGSRRGPDGDLAPGDLFVDGDDHGSPPIGR